MLYTIKNKERFKVRKNLNKKINAEKDLEKKEMYKLQKTMSNYSIKKSISIDKNLIKTALYFLDFYIKEENNLSLIQKYILLYEMKKWNDFSKIIEAKQIKDILSEIDDINLETIVNLVNPKFKNDVVYTNIYIEKEKLDINNLEKTIKKNIKTNKYMHFYYIISKAMAGRFVPGKYNYENVVIKINTKNPVYFRDYFKKDDENYKNMRKFIYNDVIDFLTDDYTICNLEQIKDYMIMDSLPDNKRLNYLQNNINGKDYYNGERRYEWE